MGHCWKQKSRWSCRWCPQSAARRSGTTAKCHHTSRPRRTRRRQHDIPCLSPSQRSQGTRTSCRRTLRPRRSCSPRRDTPFLKVTLHTHHCHCRCRPCSSRRRRDTRRRGRCWPSPGCRRRWPRRCASCRTPCTPRHTPCRNTRRRYTSRSHSHRRRCTSLLAPSSWPSGHHRQRARTTGRTRGPGGACGEKCRERRRLITRPASFRSGCQLQAAQTGASNPV
jgi:hypothetical protein